MIIILIDFVRLLSKIINNEVWSACAKKKEEGRYFQFFKIQYFSQILLRYLFLKVDFVDVSSKD